MISLNVDFGILTRYFGVSPSNMVHYRNKSFEQIMRIEAANGNEKAAKYKEILSNPSKVLEIFKLSNPENKLAILQNMNEDDLDKLLPFLNNEQLSMGLRYFNDDKLLSLCEELPKEELIKMVFQKFSIYDVLFRMENKDMDKFIQQPSVDRKYSEKFFEGLDKKHLEQIMVQALGADYKDKSKDEYLDTLKNMDDKHYTRFLLGLERENKMLLIGNIIEQEPKFLLLFDNKDLAKPMDFLEKEDKIKMMQTIDQEFLIPMIQELPLDLTQIVLTQIDPNDFSKVLANDFQYALLNAVLFKR